MGNNPISFVDPEGDLPFIAVIAIGAASTVFSNGLSNISQGNNFFDGAGKAAFWGGIGAAASLGVGTVFGATGTFAKELGRAGAHAITQGGMSAAQGGSFWQGALSGGISSGIGSGIDALGGKAGHQILGGGLGGGIGSSIGGGNFFDGFSQGVAVGAFNHALHNGATALSNNSKDVCIPCISERTILTAKFIGEGMHPVAAIAKATLLVDGKYGLLSIAHVTAAITPGPFDDIAVLGFAAKWVNSSLKLRPDIVLSGGRSGQLVKNLTGPANSVLKGSGNRIFITDDAGKVIWDITKDRAKSVIPGKGFGPKVTPTKEQLKFLKQIWGN